MNDPGAVVSGALPRPGRALQAILIVIAVCAVSGAVVVNWAPGGRPGIELFRIFAFDPAEPYRAWTWLTSGVLTSPQGFSHALWSLVGLYFLTTDLEKRWGSARLLWFLAASVVLGNLAVFAVQFLPLRNAIFHPQIAVGPLAAITATAIAWSKENAKRQVRLFFFLPVSGKALYAITVGFCVLSLLFLQGTPEGAAAPFGGIVSGALFGGTPSPIRALWLRMKLSRLRRRGSILTVESLLDSPARPRVPKRKGSPPLQLIQGGASTLEDELQKRKPPKDKRYLN